MPDQVILCPYCNREIPLTEALSHQIREKLRGEVEAEVREREKVLADRERALAKKEKEVKDLKRSFDEQLAKRLEDERGKLEKEVKEKVEEKTALELRDLRQQIAEKDEELEKTRKTELELRRERRRLEDSRKALELEMTRKLDEERAKIRDEAVKRVTEEHRLKDREKEEQMSAMKKQIEDLKRKAEQASQQMQGEVLELELEDILKANLPMDDIEPVPKGMRGADVLQNVYSHSGRRCGTIIWESKRTKSWSDSWIEKLKHDQRKVKAEIAVIMSTALPKEISNFGYVKGVWVTDYSCAVGLATALREGLIQVGTAKSALVGKSTKMEIMYNYLCGSQFRQRVEAILEAFLSMKKQLEQEKRAMTNIWAKREKQMEQIVGNVSGMYGDLQGIVGSSLPQLKGLELKALPSKDGA